MEKSLSSRRENIFFQNLLALGFDVSAMSKEHKIAFHKKMFSLPNRKGFEVITRFLFIKLNEVSQEKYSIIWPLLDVKDQRQFQKTSFDNLTRIAQISEIKFPLVLNSVFASYGGEAFLELYFSFSTHVVQQVNKTFGPMLRRARPNPNFIKHTIEMLKLTSISSVEKFQALTDATHFYLSTFFNIAKKLTDTVERLKLSNSRSQSLLEEKVKTSVNILTQKDNLIENSLEGLTLKNKEYQDKVEILWKKLEDFLSIEEGLWSVISSDLEENAKPILKGSFCYPLSDKLKNSYQEIYKTQLNEGDFTSPLLIPKFLKVFCLVLEFYVDSIKKGRFSDSYKLQFFKDTSELDESIKMLQSFCISLEDGNAVNKNRVEALMKNINIEDFTGKKSDYVEDLPPSPDEFLLVNVDIQKASGSIFSYPNFEDTELDKNSENKLKVDNSVVQIDSIPNERSSVIQIDQISKDDQSVFSSIQIGDSSFLTSLKNEPSYNDLNSSADKGNFYQTSVAKDSVSNCSVFDIPTSWLHEESLNSQTLIDQASLSFLD